MATPASAPDTRALVADFVGYKLRQKGYVCGAGPGEGPAADPLHQAMRAAGDEFETRFRRTFSDLAAQLHVTPGSAQQRFTQVSDELFQGGPNWGRLVAFFVFGAALCAESVNKEMATRHSPQKSKTKPERETTLYSEKACSEATSSCAE